MAEHTVHRARLGTETKPDGVPIHTTTIWLDFGDEGEIAVSADTSAFHAALDELRHPPS